jgi:hypothetical protein
LSVEVVGIAAAAVLPNIRIILVNMAKPIPDAIKEILGALTPAQQVTMRSYIASLRSEIKDLEADLLAKNDEDPHAHYHGHDKVCMYACMCLRMYFSGRVALGRNTTKRQ